MAFIRIDLKTNKALLYFSIGQDDNYTKPQKLISGSFHSCKTMSFEPVPSCKYMASFLPIYQ